MRENSKILRIKWSLTVHINCKFFSIKLCKKKETNESALHSRSFTIFSDSEMWDMIISRGHMWYHDKLVFMKKRHSTQMYVQLMFYGQSLSRSLHKCVHYEWNKFKLKSVLVNLSHCSCSRERIPKKKIIFYSSRARSWGLRDITRIADFFYPTTYSKIYCSIGKKWLIAFEILIAIYFYWYWLLPPSFRCYQINC